MTHMKDKNIKMKNYKMINYKHKRSHRIKMDYKNKKKKTLMTNNRLMNRNNKK